MSAASALSGCYLDGDDDFTGYGELSIVYTFDGLSCDEVGVARIRLTIEGQTRGDAYFDTLDCSVFRNGVDVFDLLSDEYAVTVEGLDADGGVLYSMDRPLAVQVHGDAFNEAVVNLVSSFGDLAVFWTFPDAAECGEVTEVRVILRDPNGLIYDDARYPCDFGGIEYTRLRAGRWSVEMRALDVAGNVLYRLAERVVEVFARAYNEYDVLLND